MNAVWPDAFVEEANLSQSVFILRKTLGERAQQNRYIATIPGRGYSFVASVEELRECNEKSSHDTISGGADSRSSKTARTDAQAVSWFSSYLKSRWGWVTTLVVAGMVLVFGVALSFPRIARTCNNHGVLHQQKGEIEAAIEDYRLALKLSPNYAEANYNLGDAYEEIPDYDKALEQYQRALDVDPTFYPAYNNLSRLYIMRRKDYPAALRLLDHALNLRPQEAQVQYTLYKNYGWANLELGQLSQAEQNLKSAMRLEPQRGSAHCLTARVLVAQGKATGALTEWESCLAYSNQPEVEPEWRNEAQEHLSKRE